MPRDHAGAPAPQPTPWADYLSRLKLARRKRRHEDYVRRRVTRQRLAVLEHLMAAIIDNSDIIAEVTVEEPIPSIGVCILTVLDRVHFRELCRLGAELEGDEENGDDEPSWGDTAGAEDLEPSLGSSDAEIDQTNWSAGIWHDAEDDDEAEPSLGSPDGIINQERWHDGDRHAMFEERELDRCDDEPNGDDEPGCDDEYSLAAAEGMSVNCSGPDLEEGTPLPPEKVTAVRARYFAARPRLARTLGVKP